MKTKLTKREREVKARRKMRACVRLGKALPDIEKRVNLHLGYKGIPRKKVAAATVRLMQSLLFRVGGMKAVEEHETFGVTTLQSRHVQIKGDNLHFTFIGKAGVSWKRSIVDKQLAELLSTLKAAVSPNDRLFWYYDGTQKTSLTNNDVRRWLKGFKVNPKDFRTYTANILLFNELEKRSRNKHAQKLSRSAARQQVTDAFQVVAEKMGHKVSTCRGQYVFPPLWHDYVNNGGLLTVSEPFEAGAVLKK